jgi:hypothetical protein
MQALGAPPPDLHGNSEYQQYPPPGRPTGGRGPSGPGGPQRPGADRSKLLDYSLKCLGLVGVALIAGFLWFLIRNNPAQPTPAQSSPPATTTGVYAFQAYHGATQETDCAGHSTGLVKNYLAGHSCSQLTRSLYTASLTNGQKVVTSVAVVQMSSAADASALKKISDKDGSGHVKDLVEDGVVIPGGPGSLQDAGYYSMTKDSRLIVVMTEYVDGSMDSASNLQSADADLKAVSKDAANQGIGQNN